MSNEELVKKIQSGENEYMGELYTKNLPLIKKIVSPYVRGAEVEDCMQETYFGLLSAVKHYESDKNIKFMSFARWYLIRAVEDYLYNQASLIRMPAHIHEKTQKYKKAVNQLVQNNIEPTEERITEITGLDKETQTAIKIHIQGISSLDVPLQDGDGDDTETKLNFLEADDTPDQDAVDSLYREYLKNNIWNTVHETLSEREEFIIIQSIIYNASLQQVSDKIGTSRERVSQIKHNSYKKLRDKCRKYLDDYNSVNAHIYNGGYRSYRYHLDSIVERIVLERLDIEAALKELAKIAI